MPWWAVIGGLVGAVQVYAGLTLVTKVGAGPFVGLTVTAALIMSLVIDHFGWFRMAYHPLNIWGIVGGLLLVGGVDGSSRVLNAPNILCDSLPLPMADGKLGQPRINQQSLFVCVFRSLKTFALGSLSGERARLCAQTLDSVAS